MLKRALVASLIVSAGLLTIWACSFPDVSFAPADGVAGEAGSRGEAGNDGGGDAPKDGPRSDGPTVNPDVDPEGGAQDATFIDGSGKIDAGPDAQCCDCDTDSINRTATGCAAPPQPDCDDLNPNIKPGASFVASVTWDSDHQPAYDYDCNGTVVKQYVHSVAPCAGQLKLSGCSNFQGGFNGNPSCGETGRYVVTCGDNPALLSLDCKEMAFESRRQGCR